MYSCLWVSGKHLVFLHLARQVCWEGGGEGRGVLLVGRVGVGARCSLGGACWGGGEVFSWWGVLEWGRDVLLVE